MVRLSPARTILAGVIAAAAAAAVAGCSPQYDLSSSHPSQPASSHQPKPHHSPSATPTSPGTTGPGAPVPATGTAPPGPTSPGTAPPGSTSPGTTPSSTAPVSSAPGSGRTCTTSAAKGSCGPYTDPQIQGTSSEPTVNNDVWNPISGWQQTLSASGPGSWSVTASMPAGNTAVVSYPSSGSNYNEKPLSSFAVLRSSFSETMNATSKTSAWAAYDVWLNDWNNEVMIQHDFASNGACPTLASASFGGSGGVPVQTWNLCKYSSELIWKLASGSEQTGSVDILSMLTWLENHGYLQSRSTLTSIGYGWELASTGGVNETFTVSSYSITAS